MLRGEVRQPGSLGPRSGGGTRLRSSASGTGAGWSGRRAVPAEGTREGTVGDK